MKRQSKITEMLDEDLERVLQMLIDRASTESVRRRLRNMHEACRHLVSHGKSLTVPRVVKTCKDFFDEEIGDSTIRNKRSGDNPYQSLYQKWTLVAAAMIAAEVRRIVPLDSGHFGQDQISRISDPLLQSQVTILFAKARSFEQQLNILKENRDGVPQILDGVGPSLRRSDTVLSDGEIEALQDFVNPRSMQSKLLVSTNAGAVTLRDGRPIADPGFMSALEKIIKQHKTPSG